MDVKEAVATAKKYVTEVFEGEDLADMGLEEVVFDDEADIWKVTIGFMHSSSLVLQDRNCNHSIPVFM